MKNIKIIFFFLFLYTTNALSMEEKEFIAERCELLLQIEEIWFNEEEKVDEYPGHIKLFEKLKEVAAQDNKYQNIFVNKKFKHSIIERNRQALHPDKIK